MDESGTVYHLCNYMYQHICFTILSVMYSFYKLNLLIFLNLFIKKNEFVNSNN